MTSPGLTDHRPEGEHAAAASRHARRLYHRGNRSPSCGTGYARAGWRGAWAARGGAAGLAALISLAAACSSAQPNVPLPSRASQVSAPSPVSPAPAATSARAAAIAAYLAIWPAGDRAERSGSAASARAILAPYATAAYIGFMVSGMAGYWQRHEVARGHMVDHVMQAVVLTGRGGRQAAIVVDCQDASHHWLASGSSGQVIPGTSGPSRAKLNASMALAGGRWVVGNITFTGNTC
jgi:hypothetical protein